MKEGESLYQFTHRTFLEYFTASHLVRISRTPDNLKETLLPKIAKREWDVVAQLAFRIQDKQTEEAGDEMLAALIERSFEVEESERWNLLSFAARCLEFMVPNPVIRRKITVACVEFCIVCGLKRMKEEQLNNDDSKGFDSAQPARELMSSLLSCLIENRTTVVDSLQQLIIEHINNDHDDDKSFIACEIGLQVYIPVIFITPSIQQSLRDVEDFWIDLSNSILTLSYERICSLCHKYLPMCIKQMPTGNLITWISISDLVHWHGVNCLFKSARLIVYEGITMASATESVLRQLVSVATEVELQKQLVNDLSKLGELFIASSAPFIRRSEFSSISSIRNERFLEQFKIIMQLNLPSDCIFAIFIILAVHFEVFVDSTKATINGEEDSKQLMMRFENNPSQYFDFLWQTLLSRYKSVEVDKIESELKSCNFSSEQISFIEKWTQRKIDLVDQTVEEKLVES
jgi:hypothetical protein